MGNSLPKRDARYRVWITRSGDVVMPPEADPAATATVLEPAEEGTLSWRRAARYVAAFNEAAQAHRRFVRAVALPVAVRYEGDPTPGQSLRRQ